jgi:hypothetical protein
MHACMHDEVDDRRSTNWFGSNLLPDQGLVAPPGFEVSAVLAA